jgi:hypothetical protein
MPNCSNRLGSSCLALQPRHDSPHRAHATMLC